jgi:glucose-6-phosphate-specific signal transduction histidine kinase
MNAKDYLPTMVAACVLILLTALESWLPAAVDRQRRLRHAARNLSLGSLNVALLALLATLRPLSLAGRRWSNLL